MTQGFVQVDDHNIHIETHYVNEALTLSHQEIILEIFSEKYNQQKVHVWARDGENLEHNGVLPFVSNLCKKFKIPATLVVVHSHDKNFCSDFEHELLPLGIFQNIVPYLQQEYALTDNAKFVGCTIGRFTPSRLLLARELDLNFSNNLFLIWNSDKQYVSRYYQTLGLDYQRISQWVSSKTFDHDLNLKNQYGGPAGGVAWQDACNSYHTIWGQYQIEIVAETHSLSNYWFTEKTSRCLATGKPFLLFSGTGSLKYLRELGYKTNANVLDENYDLALTPSQRIKAMVAALCELYHSPTRDQKIQELNEIAQHNKEIFLHAYHNQI